MTRKLGLLADNKLEVMLKGAVVEYQVLYLCQLMYTNYFN